ncbi:hypothetical protein MM300_01910 [Evansella sp. LMS18]|uniref:UPF0738 family protein n=1 Tax=Evansella sp. LMS18 TaxID=2924033 RepID=UPI0020D0FDE8|nr:hypothetical protein [Evansella sp. LMS18]UTR11110.1 hypothetical protein MM300_01910 [Evansella sp. LMS18]
MISLEVKEIVKEEATLKVYANTEDNTEKLQELEPEGQILADSDGKAFVYLLADQEGFAHLRFPEQVWGVLSEERKTTPPVKFQLDQNTAVELPEFWTELNSLLENIQGNSNYGPEMVEAVETIFELDME